MDIKERLRAAANQYGGHDPVEIRDLALVALAQIERLEGEVKAFDPDPVVCGCREALCPHTPLARLPRQQLVDNFKDLLRTQRAEIERLETALVDCNAQRALERSAKNQARADLVKLSRGAVRSTGL